MTHASLILSTPFVLMEVCSIGGFYGSAVASACIKVSYSCIQCLMCKESSGYLGNFVMWSNHNQWLYEEHQCVYEGLLLCLLMWVNMFCVLTSFINNTDSVEHEEATHSKTWAQMEWKLSCQGEVKHIFGLQTPSLYHLIPLDVWQAVICTFKSTFFLTFHGSRDAGVDENLTIAAFHLGEMFLGSGIVQAGPL